MTSDDEWIEKNMSVDKYNKQWTAILEPNDSRYRTCTSNYRPWCIRLPRSVRGLRRGRRWRYLGGRRRSCGSSRCTWVIVKNYRLVVPRREYWLQCCNKRWSWARFDSNEGATARSDRTACPCALWCLFTGDWASAEKQKMAEKQGNSVLPWKPKSTTADGEDKTYDQDVRKFLGHRAFVRFRSIFRKKTPICTFLATRKQTTTYCLVPLWRSRMLDQADRYKLRHL